MLPQACSSAFTANRSGVGAPLSITAQELRLECMFPADEESEKSHREMMATNPKRKNNAG
jgi:hypothetical protein